MKRTKKMMFVTLMAVTAVTMLLMSKAFAAPAVNTNNNCPTKNILNQLTKNGAGLNSVNSADLQKFLDSMNAPGTGDSQMKLNIQDLLNKYGVKLPANTKCPKTTQAPKPTATAPATTPAATPSATPTATVKATPAPTATVPPVSGNMSADEQKMINLVNQDRAANGLPALTFDSSLRAGALEHSRDMMQNNYFSHTSPTQGDFTTRIRAAGVKYTAAGENIAKYGSVESAEVGFMNSPGHRANILNANFTRIGIGIVYNNGAYYITQWFAK